MEELTCLRCGVEMQHLRRTRLQLGQTGWVLGDLPNLLAGGLPVEIYECPVCGKLEFFRGEEVVANTGDGIAQVRCPRCGQTHDMDYPKCPYCKHDYSAE